MKQAVTTANADAMVEIIKTYPSFLWFYLVLAILVIYRKQIGQLLGRVEGFEIGKVRVSLKNSLDAAVKQGRGQAFITGRLASSISCAADLGKGSTVRSGPGADEPGVVERPVYVSAEARRQVLKRALRDKHLLEGACFLWVDDHPENNNNERRMYQELGVFIDVAESTKSALSKLRQNDYDCVISDMHRDRSETAGLELAGMLGFSGRNGPTPLIIYLGKFDPEKEVPAKLFGITNRPDELLHLTLDVMSRQRYGGK
ncbi:response regulator [Prosthecochloris sp. GSB1]|uniref:response regulator n=1 Tax=Prosthecochloris sp. GSB1 TaxID=281093 RepID=UPI00142DF44D|nr:response regulator [Prosthecochloris sp. GSB1]